MLFLYYATTMRFKKGKAIYNHELGGISECTSTSHGV